MRVTYTCSLIFLATVCLLSLPSRSQRSERPKLCVALVNNRTTELLSPDRMTARLVKAATNKKLSAVAMNSATGDVRKLRPTLENSQEMKEKECDYIALTMITGSSNYGGPSNDAEVSIGHAKVPSIDASDPMGGSSGPVYRNDLDINFAVFRAGHVEALLDTTLQDRARANVSDSLMDAMDREANRVRHELKKK
jgi:hypothetical protein